MNSALKKELKKAFEAPAPARREAFLQEIAEPAGISLFSFLLIQAQYIRKRTITVSICAFAAVLFGSLILVADMLRAVSAFTPLLALTLVAETGRSEHYGMAELEMATRFSLKSTLLARLAILGTGNLLLLLLLFPLSLRNNDTSPLRAGLFIITPLLLSTFLCLHIVRRRRDRDGVYLCTGVCAFVSLITFVLHHNNNPVFLWLLEESSCAGWIAAVMLLFAGTVKQYQNLIDREELVWN